MIEKIKSLFFFKLGMHISDKHIWMLIALFLSILFLIASVMLNMDSGSPTLTPKPNIQ
ncbi:MAG: hypothetical protein ACD_56C00059G0003 [uncultured bacterium]|nr:MAG: hypothetical protein ACD_56C00059G0003 [uncultured bacterium]